MKRGNELLFRRDFLDLAAVCSLAAAASSIFAKFFPITLTRLSVARSAGSLPLFAHPHRRRFSGLLPPQLVQGAERQLMRRLIVQSGSRIAVGILRSSVGSCHWHRIHVGHKQTFDAAPQPVPCPAMPYCKDIRKVIKERNLRA